MILTACGGDDGDAPDRGAPAAARGPRAGTATTAPAVTASGRVRRRDDHLCTLGLQPAARLPGVRRRVPQANPNINGQDQTTAAGTTTGATSRPAWSAAPRPTSSPITWLSIPEFANKRPAPRHPAAGGHGQGRYRPVSDRPGRPVGAKTASAMACPRTGTRSPSSTTRTCSRRPASTRRRSRT